ncbi:hypothetical protein ON010_g14234 [Phytophthora cinnamomi]|nr:hypothetical protein ON010_g14234 [Phytophthora cinnamomi]
MSLSTLFKEPKPKNNKRLQQIAELAAAKRSRDRQVHDQGPKPTTQAPLAALPLEAQSTHSCCPTIVVEENETSTENDSSDFVEGLVEGRTGILHVGLGQDTAEAWSEAN